MEWYLAVVKNYVGFSGRARRKEFWMFVLINAIIGMILSIVGAVIKTNVLSSIYSLAILLPSLAVQVRRLHDTGKSGVLIIISIVLNVITGILFAVFIAGAFATAISSSATGLESISILAILFLVADLIYAIVLLVFLCKEGDAEDNKYGANPKKEVA